MNDDDMAADLFTEGAHNHKCHLYHTNFIFQGKQSRTISANAHYFILLKNPRNLQQVEVFGRQVYQKNPISSVKEQP